MSKITIPESLLVEVLRDLCPRVLLDEVRVEFVREERIEDDPARPEVIREKRTTYSLTFSTRSMSDVGRSFVPSPVLESEEILEDDVPF